MFAQARATSQANRRGPTPTAARPAGLGNQARLRRFAQSASRPSVQARAEAPGSGLVVGAENDPLEHEADRVADQVMSAPPPGGPLPSAAGPAQVSRKCAACEEEDRKNQAAVTSSAPVGISRKCASCAAQEDRSRALRAAPAEPGSLEAGSAAPASVERVLGSAGRPLDPGERGFFEPRFGRDFGRVRLHADAEAGASAREVGALAYAVGEHVVVDPGRYAAGSEAGRRLLAHELAHVVQQGGSAPLPEGEGASGGPDAQAAAPRPALAAPVRRLQRYSHSDCKEDDLKAKIWPGDGIAKDMVDKAIRVLSATPIDPAVTPLFTRFFMSSTPTVSTILGVYKKIKADFTGNSYTYECEDSCDDCSYVRDRMRYIGLNPNIHICMNQVSTASPTCFGYLIVHEFAHYSAHCDDNAYCAGAGCCTTAACPSSLSASDALDNADSYSGFALDLYPMSV